MDRDHEVAELLRWRLAVAEATAPAPPSARALLEAARPWWERWPDRFRSHVERLRAMPLQVGFAMVSSSPEDRGHPVPVVIERGSGGEAQARVVYLAVIGEMLRLRFALDESGTAGDLRLDGGDVVEVTLVSQGDGSPLLEAAAERTGNDEYRLEAMLPAALAEAWRRLRVADPMPFAMILRPVERRG